MAQKEPGIDLVAAFERRIDEGIDVSQICRTCPKNAQKRIYKCEPDKHLQITPIPVPGTEQKVALTKKDQVAVRPATAVAVDNRDAFALANVDSCGWKQLPKCNGCGNFRKIEITVLAGKRGTKDRYRNITVGGYCAIGAGGVRVGTQVLYCNRVPRAIDISDDTRQSCATCRWATANFEVGMIEHATPIEYELNPYEMELARQNPHPELGVAGAITEARRRKGQVWFPIYRGARRLTPAWTGLHRTYKMRIAPGGITYRNYRQPDGTYVEKPYSYKVVLGTTGETAELFADTSADAPMSRATITTDGTSYKSVPGDAFGMVTQISPNEIVVEVHAPWYRYLMLPDRDQVQRKIMVQEDCTYCEGRGVVQDVSGPPSQWNSAKKELTVPRRWRLCPVCDSGEFFQPRQMPRSAKTEGHRGKHAAIPKVPLRSELIRGKIKDNCPRCDPKWGPCYFHLKSPTTRPRYEYTIGKDGEGIYAPVAGDAAFEFDTPEAVTPTIDIPERALHYDRTAKAVVDGNGNTPHPNVLLMRWEALLRHTRSEEQRRDIIAQVSRVLNTLEMSKPRRVNYSWNKESSRDPWHGYCALNAYDKEHGGHPEGLHDLSTGDKLRSSRSVADMGDQEREELHAELAELKGRGRSEIRKALEAARALGDLSENGDYQAAKDTQGMIESRIRQIEIMLSGHSQVDRGVKARGLDFQLLWNDQFGTPRSNQSTNPQLTYVNPSSSLLEERADLQKNVGALGKYKTKLEIVDPNFALPKYQERMEFERTTSTGMRLQEEMLLNEGLEKAGQQDPTLTINGQKVHVERDPKDISSNAMVQDLGLALPIEANVHWEPDETATTADPDWPGERSYWAGPRTGGEPQRLPSKKLLAWLDETVHLEGSEKTRTSGYYITNRQRVLGYSNMHNMRVQDMDILSVAEGEDEPHSDPVTPAQESNEYLVCPKCFREFETDDAGVFQAEEIEDEDLLCPSGDGGLLIKRIRRPEWLDAAFHLDSDQVREFIDPTYRREVDGRLAAPPDTASWNNRLRLEQMYCPHWTPKIQTPRNQV